MATALHKISAIEYLEGNIVCILELSRQCSGFFDHEQAKWSTIAPAQLSGDDIAVICPHDKFEVDFYADMLIESVDDMFTVRVAAGKELK